jgi:hypothetical protein
MTRLLENHNRAIPLDAEVIRSFICDAADGSLSATNAAAVVLQHIGGATAGQLIAAAIDLLREVGEIHAETIAELTGERDQIQDDLAELDGTIERLKAKLAKQGAAP